MNINSKTIAGVAMTGIVALASVLPAQAQNVTISVGQRERVITTYCDRNPGDSDCRRYHGGYWEDRDYDRFYSRHRTGLDSIASGLFGFTFGAIVGGAIANSNNNSGSRVIYQGGQSHVDACYARYRSYDARTDTFLGYDGYRHRCNL